MLQGFERNLFWVKWVIYAVLAGWALYGIYLVLISDYYDWFYAIVSTLVILAIALIDNMRRNRERKRQKEKKARLKNPTPEIPSEHKTK